MPPLHVPIGTVTFLFTDIEGSTRLWEAYPDAMKAALARHDTILRTCIERYDGYVFKTIGDAFCAAFTTATEALNAVLAAQLGLKNEPWPEQVSIQVRMALHTGAVESRDKHLAYFIAQAEALNPVVHSPRMRETLDRMKEDIDNYRAGLEWSGAAPERAAPGLCLALEVTKFMRAHGYFMERRDQLSRALGAAGGVNPRLRARGLFALGYYALTFLDFETAHRTLGESLAIRQALGERLGIAETLDALGHLALMQEDYAPARQLSEECLRLQRMLGNHEGIASALGNLGAIAYDEGDLAASRLFWEESLPIRHSVGNPFPIYVAHLCLGEIDLDEKDYCAAGAALRECLAIAMEHKLKGCTPWALNALAAVFAVTDTPTNAVRLWGAGERLYEEGSETIGVRRRKRIDAQIAGARAALGDDAAFDAPWQEGRAMTLDQAVALAQQGSLWPLFTDVSTAD